MKKRRAVILNVHVSIREFLRHLLAAKGYEVVSAGVSMRCLQPEASKDACLQGPPCADLFIMESSESRGNSLELLHRQARLGCGMEGRNKAVFAGIADAKKQLQFERLGCTWFTIPFDFDRLSNWIDSCSDRCIPPKPMDIDGAARILPRDEPSA